MFLGDDILFPQDGHLLISKTQKPLKDFLVVLSQQRGITGRQFQITDLPGGPHQFQLPKLRVIDFDKGISGPKVTVGIKVFIVSGRCGGNFISTSDERSC
jgi:hypothetical protein